jgi:thioredoxin reductase
MSGERAEPQTRKEKGRNLHAADEHDVVVVGAGVAGLSAALILGRSRRKTLVLDGGEPRNAPSAGVHGFFSRDGVPPEELLRIGREQLAPYPDVGLRRARATDATGEDGDFRVALEDDSTVRSRKLVLATGVADELPETPGFGELWGRGVYHCPYCHGWEVRDRPLAVLAAGEEAVHRAAFLRTWSRDLVVLTDGSSGLDGAARGRLEALGIGLREEKIAGLESEGGSLRRIVFEGGDALEREGLFYTPPQRQRSDLAGALGCEVEAVGYAGAVVKADQITRETTVAGVYAAGDAQTPLQSAILAASSGAQAAYALNHALAAEDAEAEVLAQRPPRSPEGYTARDAPSKGAAG